MEWESCDICHSLLYPPNQKSHRLSEYPNQFATTLLLSWALSLFPLLLGFQWLQVLPSSSSVSLLVMELWARPVCSFATPVTNFPLYDTLSFISHKICLLVLNHGPFGCSFFSHFSCVFIWVLQLLWCFQQIDLLFLPPSTFSSIFDDVSLSEMCCFLLSFFYVDSCT